MKLTTILTLASVLWTSVSCDADFRFPADNPCIRLQGDLGLSMVAFTQPLPDATTVAVDTGTVTNSSHCDDGSEAVLDILLESNVTLTFTFSKQNNSSVSMVTSVSFIPNQLFNETTDSDVVTMINLLPKGLPAPDKSYECVNGDDPIVMNISASGNTSYSGVLSINKIVVQAFQMENGTFSPGDNCNLIPITSLAPTVPSITTPTPGSPPRQQYISSDNRVTCIVLDAGIEVIIPYKSNGKTDAKVIGIPVLDTSAKGTCASDLPVESIVLTFYGDWQLGFVFEKNKKFFGLYGDSNSYYLQSVSLSYNLSKNLFPDADNAGQSNSTVTNMKPGTLSANVGGNYKCDTKTELQLHYGIIVNLYDLQYMAYNTDNSTEFNTNSVSSCHAATPSGDGGGNNGGVIAAVVISVVVVLVIIGYIVYRKRKSRTYEQVY